jgi:pimeloyl-ACP methyl ester carboxylesterase
MSDRAPSDRKEPSPRSRKLTSWVLWGLIGLGSLALLAWLAVGTVAASKLTVPTRLFDASRTPQTYGMAYEDVGFVSRDGRTRLAGWYIPSETNERVIIFVHGRDASRTAAYGSAPADDGSQPVPGRLLELTSALNKAGVSVFLFDLRGHGQSGEGRFSFGVKERLDVLAAIDWVKAKGYQPGRIGVMGLSLGGASSIGATVADRSVGALVIDSSFAELTPIVEARWVEESGLPMAFLAPTKLMVRLMYGWDMDAVNPSQEIGQVSPRPLMIIACQDDQVVPAIHFQHLKAAAPGAQTWVLPHCEHGQTYNADPAAFEQKVIRFFDASLK